MTSPLLAPLLNWLKRLRHRNLFLVVALLLGIDVVIPDVVPFIDELLLAAVTLWLGGRKRKPAEPSAG
ncbi:MAG: hypothetical protein KDI69_06115 [Xanthomonadales bacterium]|nr:hypothetical protein [Xanthomonadales bacterium]